MTGIDGYDWSVFGGNPVPGDPDEVRRIAIQLREVADTTSQQERLLRATGEGVASVWSGPAASKFYPKVQVLSGQLTKVVTSYDDAADALDGYWPALRDAQQLALAARAKAVAATAALGQARAQSAVANEAAAVAASNYNSAVLEPVFSPAVSLCSPGSAFCADPVSTAAHAYSQATANAAAAAAAVSAAQAQLDAAHQQKDAAVRKARVAASVVAHSLQAASNAGIHNPHHSWLSSVVDDIGSVASGVWHQTSEFASGVWQGVSGPLVMLAKLADPLTAPGEMEQLAKGLAFGLTHPLQMGEAMLDWKDLSSGNVARWLGNLAPAVAAAVLTGGAGDVADGVSGLTAVERAGVSADDVAAIVANGDQQAAARIIMRGDDPVPGSIYHGLDPQPGRMLTNPHTPDKLWAEEQGNFVLSEPWSVNSPTGEQWGVNVHDSGTPLYGDEGGNRSLQYSAPPTEILGINSTEEYVQRWALKPSWGDRNEVTVLHYDSSTPGPMWQGVTGPQAEAGVDYSGGGVQMLTHTAPASAAVWTGPLPWAKVPDAGLALRGAGQLAGAAGAARLPAGLHSQPSR